MPSAARPLSGCKLILVDVIIINSAEDAIKDPMYIDILMDILSERGYIVSVDSRSVSIPVKVDLATGEIMTHEQTTYLFDVRFTQHQIRGIFEGDKNIRK
jgi:adenylate kinase